MCQHCYFGFLFLVFIVFFTALLTCFKLLLTDRWSAVLIKLHYYLYSKLDLSLLCVERWISPVESCLLLEGAIQQSAIQQRVQKTDQMRKAALHAKAPAPSKAAQSTSFSSPLFTIQINWMDPNSLKTNYTFNPFDLSRFQRQI